MIWSSKEAVSAGSASLLAANFALTEDQLAIQDMARKFTADARHHPLRRRMGREAIPLSRSRPHVWKAAGELGFGAIYVSEESGGIGLGRLEAALIMEAMAYGCPATSAYHLDPQHGRVDDRHLRLADLKAASCPIWSAWTRSPYCLTEPGSALMPPRSRRRRGCDGDHYVAQRHQAVHLGRGL
jgi:alkylation response protein AidB-like acyl-CoA dehydrogenase